MNYRIVLNQSKFTPHQLNAIKECLSRLAEQAPSDAFFSAHFYKKNHECMGKLIISSQEGQFKAQSQGRVFDEILKNIQLSMSKQIEEWKSHRFSNFTSPLPTENKKVHKVLVVDDDLSMANFFSEHFKKENCHVSTSHDSFEAINALLQKNYDLVLLDWNLPGLNGGETLKTLDQFIDKDPLISENWGFKKLYVVIVSGQEIQEMEIPAGEYFEIIDFWPKKMGLLGLQKKLEQFVAV